MGSKIYNITSLGLLALLARPTHVISTPFVTIHLKKNVQYSKIFSSLPLHITNYYMIFFPHKNYSVYLSYQH